MPFRIGPTEVIIVVAIILLIFGTRRLPQIGSSMGRAIRSFHRGLSGAEQASMDNRDEPDK